MKLGIGSYTFAWAIGIPGYEPPMAPLDAFGLMDRAIGFGVEVVQYADNLPLTALTSEEKDHLAGQAQEAGIAVEIGTRGIGHDNLRENLRLAQQFAAPFVRVVIDSREDEPEAEEVIARLKSILPEFADAGVMLAIENHDRFKAKTLAAIVEELGTANVGICLDTVNSFGAMEGPEVVVPTLAPYTRNLHVKDFTIRRVPHQMGFLVEGCAAGQGRLNLPALLPLLPSDISAILELWVPPAATMAETTEREAVWAQESIPYLKTTVKRNYVETTASQ